MVSKLIRSMMRNLNREIIDDLKLARNVKHPGEGGRARENAIVEFLEKLVPKNFQVSTGFVIDALGNISPQIDIVISRRGYHPVFEVGGVKHFMIESVHAVVENKSRITDRATLTDALGKIKSVKKMDRAKKNFVPPLIELGMLIVNFLRTAPLIDYNATDYILSASGDGNVSKL